MWGAQNRPLGGASRAIVSPLAQHLGMYYKYVEYVRRGRGYKAISLESWESKFVTFQVSQKWTTLTLARAPVHIWYIPYVIRGYWRNLGEHFAAQQLFWEEFDGYLMRIMRNLPSFTPRSVLGRLYNCEISPQKVDFGSRDLKMGFTNKMPCFLLKVHTAPA